MAADLSPTMRTWMWVSVIGMIVSSATVLVVSNDWSYIGMILVALGLYVGCLAGPWPERWSTRAVISGVLMCGGLVLLIALGVVPEFLSDR
ncbi:MAG: hypothetical protein AAGF92_01410 [Myxococcota bacterium]